MKKAWIQNGLVHDVCQGDPAQTYHPDIAAQYTTDVPDDAINGARLVEGAWVNPPPALPLPPPDLTNFKVSKWDAVKQIRDKKVQNGGYKVVVLNADKWFHSDTFSRTQQMGLVMFGAACPAVPWKTLDGSFVTMSQALAGQIFAAAALQDQSVFARAEALKILIYASTDIESVNITTGWPETYQGA